MLNYIRERKIMKKKKGESDERPGKERVVKEGRGGMRENTGVVEHVEND